MADLTKFLSKDLRTGSKADLYLNRWPQIGAGVIDKLDPLYLKLTGKGKLLIWEFDASVEIVMPDLNPSGICRIKVGPNPLVETKYWTEGGKLRMEAYNITAYSDGHWTWIWVEFSIGGVPFKGWLGIWPNGYAISATDMIPGTMASPENLP